MSGKFYSGDSYILLSTSMNRNGKLSWNIHFWLGSETTQDEAGTAAYKAVELDENFGGAAVQFREVEGNESAQFLSYFKSTGGVTYEVGGVQSGFKHVEKDVYSTRLLHCKGKRTVRVREVPVAPASLNKGDVFILDLGLTLFVFNGPNANRYEKSKGIEVASKIDSDERNGRASIIILDDDIHNATFWGHFGGFHDPNSLPDGPEDTIETTAATPSRQLFKISDASGKMEFISVSPSSGKLSKDLLETNDVYLLVTSNNAKLFLWIGKKSNLQEKKEATNYALQYLKNHQLSNSTHIERVSEGFENSSFKSEFAIWDAPLSFGLKSLNTPKKVDETPLDVKEVLARKEKEDQPIDDGSGHLTIWVIKDFQMVEVPIDHYGEFYSGDCYILLYTYKKRPGGNDEYLLYFWLGNQSTADEKGAAAALTVQLDEKYGGKPVQVRVVQGKEPSHFRQLFQGRMIIYQGGNESGFSKKASHSSLPEIALFHVKGSTGLNTTALQVATTASSLNSQDSFLLVTRENVFVWSGIGSNELEITTAMNIATNVLAGKYHGHGGRSVVAVKEGNESPDFWSALGGKSAYADQSNSHESIPRDARLFSASTATGRFQVQSVSFLINSFYLSINIFQYLLD